MPTASPHVGHVDVATPEKTPFLLYAAFLGPVDFFRILFGTNFFSQLTQKSLSGSFSYPQRRQADRSFFGASTLLLLLLLLPSKSSSSSLSGKSCLPHSSQTSEVNKLKCLHFESEHYIPGSEYLKLLSSESIFFDDLSLGSSQI